MKATLFLRLWRLHILCEAGRALSCAQAARAAARRGPMRRSACSAAAEEMLLSRSQTTRSIEGRERTDRSDCSAGGNSVGLLLWKTMDALFCQSESHTNL